MIEHCDTGSSFERKHTKSDISLSEIVSCVPMTDTGSEWEL